MSERMVFIMNYLLRTIGLKAQSSQLEAMVNHIRR